MSDLQYDCWVKRDGYLIVRLRQAVRLEKFQIYYRL